MYSRLATLVLLAASTAVGWAREIAAIDSDYLFLYVGPSTLFASEGGLSDPLAPTLTRGVFARYPIKENAIVCEYRGPVIDSQDRGSLDETYWMMTTGPRGEQLIILGEGICPLINDCVSVLNNTLLTPEFVSSWAANITTQDNRAIVPPEIACSQGRQHNVRIASNQSKVFYVATRDIDAGEELFVFYGQGYWQTFVHKRVALGEGGGDGGASNREQYSRVQAT